MPYVIVEVNNAAANAFGLDVSFSSSTPFATIIDTQKLVFNKLKNLLLTRIGERPLQPEFGTDLFKILFEVNSSELQEQISEYIVPKISYWIPEVSVTNIVVKTIEDDPTMIHTLEISIEYEFANINTNTITLAFDDNGTIQIVQGQ